MAEQVLIQFRVDKALKQEVTLPEQTITRTEAAVYLVAYGYCQKSEIIRYIYRKDNMEIYLSRVRLGLFAAFAYIKWQVKQTMMRRGVL